MKKKLKLQDKILTAFLIAVIFLMCIGVIAGAILLISDAVNTSHLSVDVKYINQTTISVVIPETQQNDYYIKNVRNLTFIVDGEVINIVDKPTMNFTYNFSVSNSKHDINVNIGLLSGGISKHSRKNFIYEGE